MINISPGECSFCHITYLRNLTWQIQINCTKLFCGPDFLYFGSSSQTTSSLALITEYQRSMSGQEFLWLLFLDPMFRRAQEFMDQSRSCYQKQIPHCTGRPMQKNIWRATSQKGLTGSLRYNISGCEDVSEGLDATLQMVELVMVQIVCESFVVSSYNDSRSLLCLLNNTKEMSNLYIMCK